MPSRGVCLSVMFVYSVETNKHIFEEFSPSGCHTILVFPHRTLWQYSDGDPPNWGFECRWGRQNSRLSVNIWLLDRRLVGCHQQHTVDGQGRMQEGADGAKAPSPEIKKIIIIYSFKYGAFYVLQFVQRSVLSW